MKPGSFIVICLGLASSASARANFGGYEAGNASTGNVEALAQVEDAFRPAGLEQVEMQNELLQITLHIESADVEVNYTLHNPDNKPVTVTAGFPTASQDIGYPGDSEGLNRARRDPRDVTDYHIFVDGKEAVWKLEAQPPAAKQSLGGPSNTGGMVFSTPLPHWFVSTVTFKAEESHAVRIRYRAHYRRAGGGFSDDDQETPTTLTYQLSTASGWKGPIGQGRVVVVADTVDADTIKVRPDSRFQRAGKAFVWSFSNLKPTLADDITVQVREGYHDVPSAMVVTKDRPEGLPAGPAYARYQIYPGGSSYLIHQMFRVTATSNLDPKLYGAQNVVYGADYAHDNAWAEGVPGDGVGEGLDLTLDRPMHVYQIGIINGFHRSPELYQENNRVAELSVSLNGEKDFTVSIPDEYLVSETYWFGLNGYEKPVKTIRLRINKVYAGTKYQDTCISKVFFKTKLAREPKIGPVR